jgi:hypothetical protein
MSIFLGLDLQNKICAADPFFGAAEQNVYLSIRLG